MITSKLQATHCNYPYSVIIVYLDQDAPLLSRVPQTLWPGRPTGRKDVGAQGNFPKRQRQPHDNEQSWVGRDGTSCSHCACLSSILAALSPPELSQIDCDSGCHCCNTLNISVPHSIATTCHPLAYLQHLSSHQAEYLIFCASGGLCPSETYRRPV